MQVRPFNKVQWAIYQRIRSFLRKSQGLEEEMDENAKMRIEEEIKALEIEEQKIRAHLIELKAEKDVLLTVYQRIVTEHDGDINESKMLSSDT